MKKNVSRFPLKAFFFIYYDQVLNNLYIYIESTFLLFLFSWLGLLHYLYSLHPDFYTLENIINIMGNFFNNGTKILKLIVRVRIYHILINI
jgi:hypothetical protein